MTASGGGAAERITGAVDRAVAWLARHWLAVFNVVVALFIALPFAAPLLLHVGSTGSCAACAAAGRLISLLYRPLCHQLPERSYYLYGPQATYTVQELEGRGAIAPGLNILQRGLLRFPGSPEVGYKVVLCQRDIAIFGAILLGGLAFGLARSLAQRRGRALPVLPFWAYVLAVIPLIVDGATQLFGLRESTWLLRSITGGLFGLATVWLAYPYIQDAMDGALRAQAARGPAVAQRDSQTGQGGGP